MLGNSSKCYSAARLDNTAASVIDAWFFNLVKGFTSKRILRSLQSLLGSVPDRCSIVSGKYRGIDCSLGE